jgi:plastocyanin
MNAGRMVIKKNYMSKTIVGVVVVFIIGGAAYYLLTMNNSGPVAPASNNSQSSEVAVSIQNMSFSPSALTVKKDTKVTWTNNDSVAHTVNSDSGNTLGSPVLAPGESFSFVFEAQGTVPYHCSIHPYMKGSVITES